MTAPSSIAVKPNGSGEVYSNPYRVLVVDDSAVIRGLITRSLESDPKIKVLQAVRNGEEALDALRQKKEIDVVVLDIEMPVMDGLTAIPKLLEINPSVNIIMASTLTLKNAEISLRALQLGAKDYVPKPTSTQELYGQDDFRLELIHKVKALAFTARGVRGIPQPERDRTVSSPLSASASGATAAAARPSDSMAQIVQAPLVDITLTKMVWARPDVIAVGSSTGGPQALLEFFKKLPASLRQPIFVTQHMPANFTTILARHITEASAWTCHEAVDGQEVLPSTAYLAPGNHHMTIRRTPDGRIIIRLNQDAPENYCRPAVDPMLRSLVDVYGKRMLVVILTGMGQDGLLGSRAVLEKGGRIIAQDQASSVVWGMPGAVAKAGICSDVLPLSDIAGKVSLIAGGAGS